MNIIFNALVFLFILINIILISKSLNKTIFTFFSPPIYNFSIIFLFDVLLEKNVPFWSFYKINEALSIFFTVIFLTFLFLNGLFFYKNS